MLEIITVLGNSNAGKDEVANFINKHYGHILLHPADGIKKFLADYYDPNGTVDLNNPVDKNIVINNETGTTYLDILVNFYKLFNVDPKLDPKFSCHYIKKKIEEYPTGRFVIRGIRTLDEVDCILDLVKNNKGELYVFTIERPEETPLPTDLYLADICTKLKEYADFTIKILNDSSLENLEAVTKLAYSLING
jgi:hypothetical protein